MLLEIFRNCRKRRKILHYFWWTERHASCERE